jgi:hypothetical protein
VGRAIRGTVGAKDGAARNGNGGREERERIDADMGGSRKKGWAVGRGIGGK